MGRPRGFNADLALESALIVFWQKGYEGTSLPDLTEAMGINRPSLYATFGNKEELFRKALDRYTQKSAENLRQMLDETTARDGVKKLLYKIADSSACPETPRGCLHVHGALSCGDNAQHIRQELSARRAGSESVLRRRFERAQAESELPATISAADLARYISTVMHGMAVQSTSGASREDLMSVAEMAMKAFPG